MNKENLLRMAEYIENIPQYLFDMDEFIAKNNCGTVGCVIGHCVWLDNPANMPHFRSGNIDFFAWSEAFTGLNSSSDEWSWLFSPQWAKVDNTPTGAARRIRAFVENGLPYDWDDQIIGGAELSY